MCASTAITPTNGTNGQQGQITVDGVAINYDVTSQSLNAIVAHIYASVQAVDAGFSIAVSPSGTVALSSTDQQISLGSASDNGNLEQVLKLDTAQVYNDGPPNSVTSAGPIGGINEATTLSSVGNAGFATAVTSGTFTINGVQISVNASDDNVASVLSKINSSTAGVVASYDLTTGTFALSNTATGPQSIVVGSSNDTSNFLKAAGLTNATGATTVVGEQAYVSVLTNSGALHTVYSNSDAVAGAIPGMAVNVTGATNIPVYRHRFSEHLDSDQRDHQFRLAVQCGDERNSDRDRAAGRSAERRFDHRQHVIEHGCLLLAASCTAIKRSRRSRAA